MRYLYALLHAMYRFGAVVIKPRQIDLLNTCLAAVGGSVGTKQYQHMYTRDEGGFLVDVLSNGEYSCAYYVSGILSSLNLISSIHATVDGLIKDLKLSGWKEVKGFQVLLEGSIIVWDARMLPTDTRPHQHVGFYIGEEQAVSTGYRTGVPVIHDQTFGGERKIVRVFRLPWLYS